ncbi:MAG: tRNA (adenosine(37)-N6)-dimethylallyltransferase MiaA [Phascolarctobacterium sp.]|nr:tRNA (adenosine(37)-N6)-dimethylallyltransferase MiaA [Phascolarctobacterium sp.]
MKQKVVAILGPTATGKSACAIELARRLNGEIISGDSMLVFKNMNIGTAKPTAEELALVPHHLVDILPPDAQFSVVDFKQQAEALIEDITARGKLPIIAGGTGLYIKAVLENYSFNEVDEDKDLRLELEREAEAKGPEVLYKRLQELDPEAASIIHPNNVRRVIRALESALKGGHVSQEVSAEPPYDALVFGLNMERDFLYERINKRVDIMLEQGLVQEVKQLLDQGVPTTCQSMQSIGYRQMVWYLEQGMAYEEAVDKLKQATRNFAKRQLTWYRKMPYIKWYEVSRELPYDEIINAMSQEIEKWQNH